jgi:hypothetical protein
MVVVVTSTVVVVAPVVVVVTGNVVVVGANVVVVPPIVVVVTGNVVVVPPIVVVVTGNVVVVPPVVVVVTGNVVVVPPIVVVVVPPPHSAPTQFNCTSWPTAFFKQRSASLAVVSPSPFVLQMQAGSQTEDPTAVRKMNKQSLATGSSPSLTGCEQRGAPGTVVVVVPPVVVVVVAGTVVVVAMTVVVVVAGTVVVVPLPQPIFVGSTRSARLAGAFAALPYVSQLQPGWNPASVLISAPLDVPSPSESAPSMAVSAAAGSLIPSAFKKSLPYGFRPPPEVVKLM